MKKTRDARRAPAIRPVLDRRRAGILLHPSSLPGENGSGGLTWYLFWIINTSGKLRLAALTPITTSSPRSRSALQTRCSACFPPMVTATSSGPKVTLKSWR